MAQVSRQALILVPLAWECKSWMGSMPWWPQPPRGVDDGTSEAVVGAGMTSRPDRRRPAPATLGRPPGWDGGGWDGRTELTRPGAVPVWEDSEPVNQWSGSTRYCGLQAALTTTCCGQFRLIHKLSGYTARPEPAGQPAQADQEDQPEPGFIHARATAAGQQ